MRELSYAQAIREALAQLMEADGRVFLIGQGVTSPWYVGATTTGLALRFGDGRVIDTPVSESGVTGAAVGAALAGMRPVLVHPRLDFMYYAMDQLANHAANWRFMFGGAMSVPLTVWGIINRGGEQAAQHSQALQAVFAHLPGLKVVMPSTPYDAKGLLISAVKDDSPVIFIDDRWLYERTGDVPEAMYTVPIGQGIIRRRGKDVTLVSFSYMALETLAAAEQMEKQGIDAEVVDLRSLKPLDEDMILASVNKTGRLVVIDGAWRSGGIAGDIVARVAEKALGALKAPPRRVTLPDTPAPASSVLEAEYYPRAPEIMAAVIGLLKEAS